MDFVYWIYILIPLLYLTLLITGSSSKGLPKFSIWGGELILLIFMTTLVFTDGMDKGGYLVAFEDAERFYDEGAQFDKDIIWSKIQIVLSPVLFRNGTLYLFLLAFIYCFSYYSFSRKYFPSQYAGYFILCVVSCLGFVSYGSNTIRAGFTLALLIYTLYATKWWVKFLLVICAVGSHLSMLLPIFGYLMAKYVLKNNKWCEYIWLGFLIITSLTSLASDIMMLIGGVDSRAEGFADFDGYSETYRTGFRWDFLIYSIAPLLFARYNFKHMIKESFFYSTIYRTYLLVNAFWLLMIRLPLTDRVAYLSWFMIPFLLLYPVLNSYLDLKSPYRYVMASIALFMGVNIVLTLR